MGRRLDLATAPFFTHRLRITHESKQSLLSRSNAHHGAATLNFAPNRFL